MKWRPHARTLARTLQESGDLHGGHWRRALEQTPRHRFVPVYYQNGGGSPTVWRQRTAADKEHWLTPIYANTSLVTRLDPATATPVEDGGWHGVPTASSTQPSLMVRMLESLDIGFKDTVLEIGTGTGYNAALIAHRLAGADQLTTADIDPELTEAARSRLASLDRPTPQVVTCDASTQQWSPRSFDRIIATCALDRIGPDLAAALAPGGRIIANVMPPLSSGLAVLHAIADGSLQGTFHCDGGSFMRARHHPTGYDTPATQRPPASGQGGPAGIPLEAFDSPHFLFLLAAHLPGVDLEYGIDDQDHATRRLVMPDGSWAKASYPPSGAAAYQQAADPDLWTVAEASWRWFDQHQRPSWGRFGLTVTPDGTHRVWFEDPGSVVAKF
ncbi:methyltransferase domain-containing protein [Streptomyces sp. H10-C2]|uniref:methyltransferase domain-containing protein n=1 Tax=Streptomyces TaxID=1883 RepID=UPI0018DF3BC7|nr:MULTISPECIES: methyltransferase domain-containing protein [Streptomyces]MDJ0344215.1 methyltransferase domain-containing protein [Streptomyces sp. PH10-H1]MDJ0373553.1 methyltransferase domain-containing protein [Streptomyces sp. H10-C2]